MRSSAFKSLFLKGLGFSGLSWLVRHTICRKRVTILVYHDPSPTVFGSHLAYLKPRFHFTSIDAMVQAMQEKDWSQTPPRSLIVTFDDGYAGTYRLLPDIIEYGLRPIVYACSGIVGTNRHFWFKEVAGGNYLSKLKRLSNSKRLDVLKQEFGFTLDKEYLERQALSLDEMREMQPYVDFGSHSMFHPILTTCDEIECRREFIDSKAQLEDLLGVPCRHFSYPNGSYSRREEQLVSEAGYASARTIDCGWNGPDANPLKLKVIGVGDSDSVTELAARLTGIPLFLSYLRKGSLEGKHPQLVRQAKDQAAHGIATK